jgi:heme-degrading monooxygenase HmoA
MVNIPRESSGRLNLQWLSESPLGQPTKEVDMFARKVSMHLKNDGALAFKQKMESDIIPLLRKQKGFLDEITLLYPTGREVHAFSLWESAEDAEAYNRGTYPEVTKIIASVIEGSPRVQTYEVLNSTIKRTLAAVVA